MAGDVEVLPADTPAGPAPAANGVNSGSSSGNATANHRRTGSQSDSLPGAGGSSSSSGPATAAYGPLHTSLSGQGSMPAPGGARKAAAGAGGGGGGGGGAGAGAPRRIPSLSKQLEQYVQELGGDRPIYSVLVANNGLAAVKFMRSVRSWASQALGNARAVSLVALATPDDMRINAEHISLADQFVEVPGGTNNNNYANVELIVQIARRAGVDAVWPGWGHASENPELPTALAAHGIRFLGPPAGPMAALGDKIGSTLLAQAAGVPTLPWSGSGVQVSVDDVRAAGGAIPPDTYAAACIDTEDVEAAAAACRKVGYPVMLKASWGGGGKGIRKVSSDDEVRAVFKQVAGEVPGSPLFAMKLAPQSRHLEVQLLCDMHGNVASLYSRDCSVQRRHQKIVEEGPVTAAPQHVLRDMERCARALARLVGYVGAATVEYLYLLEEQRYYFLELNPRLQVEHPVTEGITGVNLPACQLLVGCGVPLTRIPYIRSLYGQDPRGTAPFDLETTPQRPPEGHVVAVRVTAEDAADGFKPTAGRIDELHFRPTPDVWGYFSVKSGGGIHQYSDSQFGHLFARGESREAALRSMAAALRDCVTVRGEIRTTTDYVLDLLATPELTGNAVHTGWLDSRIAARIKPGRPPWHISVIAGAVVKSAAAVAAASSEYLGYLAKGQLPPPGISLMRLEHNMVIEGFKFAVGLVRRGPGLAAVSLNGRSVEVAYRKMGDGGFLLQVDGEAHVVHYEDEAAGTRLLVNGLTVLLAAEADPSRLTASSPGKLVRRLVPNGGRVERDQPYAEVEVMKMVMPLLSPAGGVLRWVVPEGGVMGAGELIAQLELDAGAVVAAPEPYPGTFPELGPPQIKSGQVNAVLAEAQESARAILAGFVGQPDQVVEQLVACLDSPALALMQWAAEFGVVRGRMPGALAAALEGAVAAHAADVAAAEDAADAAAAAAEAAAAEAAAAGAEEGAASPAGGGGSGAADGEEAGAAAAAAAAALVRCGDFPSAAVLEVMERALQEAPVLDRAGLAAALEPLLRLARAHAGGRQAYARSVVGEMLESFLSVEEAFTAARREGASGAGGTDGGAAASGAAGAPAAGGVGGAMAGGGGSGAVVLGTEQEAVDALRKRHAGKLSVVLDLVISHQGLALKSQLVLGLMARLVLPAPAQYRPLLRRLAALGGGGGGKGLGELSARAAQLLEQSLLADLRSVVARALSGLDMFTSGGPGGGAPPGGAGGGGEAAAGGAAAAGGGVASSPTAGVLARSSSRGGAAAGVTSPMGIAAAAAGGLAGSSPRSGGLDMLGVLSPTAAAAAGVTSPLASGSGGGGGGVVRRSTMAEGVFSGLPVSARGSIHVTSGLEAQVERLVGASAAVEDALAGLAVDAAGAPPPLRRRAALTYVKRLYSPFLLREPLVQNLNLAAAAGHAGARGGGGGVDGSLLAVWMYDDPSLANTPAATQRLGALLLLDRLTLHVALAAPPAGGVGAAAAAAAAAGGGGGGRHSRTPSFPGPSLITLGVSGDPASTAALDALLPPAEQGVEASRATAADAAAAVAGSAAALRGLGFGAVSVLAQGTTAAPLRLGWRWVPASASASPAASTPSAAAAATIPADGGAYQPDSFMSAVEPITANLLELSSLAAAAAVGGGGGGGAAAGGSAAAASGGRSGMPPAGPSAPAGGGGSAAAAVIGPGGGLVYRPSRNRQWHLYTAVERRDARSAPLRRLFVRGLVRGLGHPALLAASYSGNGGAVAAAAVNELEETLVSCLDELQRSAAAGTAATAATAAAAPADSTANRPDWTHVFMSVLPPLPLPPGGRDDSRVAAALRSAAAAVVTRHGSALRAAAVAVWEVRLRGPLREGAWRVVVSMPTGHEQGEEHVEVYREALQAAYLQAASIASTAGEPTAPTAPTAAPTAAISPAAAALLVHPLRVYVPALQYATVVPPAPAGGMGGTGMYGGGAHHILGGLHVHVPYHNHGGHIMQLGGAHRGGSGGGVISHLSHLHRQQSGGGGAGGGAQAVGGGGQLAGVVVGSPYPPLEPLQQKRLAARRHNVTYVYDFPAVFEAACRDIWAARAAAGEPNSVPPAGRLVEAVELVLPPTPAPAPAPHDAPGQPCADFRRPPRLRPAPPGRPAVGANDCGMVTWLLTLRTPECPQGRSVLAVANDITWGSGSFSPAEDAVFRAACEAALEERLPLLYLAANAGARVGLATEVRDCLQVQWSDPAAPEQGWDYLFLAERDYARLTRDTPPGGAPVVRAEPVPAPPGAPDAGATRYRLLDVVGAEDGLGVECLSGSAAIASAFCRAWREGYTATLVSGRTVGIGAYLARLGRRCIQRVDQPIVLTGYAALNKLLGRQVYTSHMQLGGPRVMGVNGVSHAVVGDDLEGVRLLMAMLAFAPPQLGAPPPALPSADPPSRPVGYCPGPGEKLDPRAAIAGREVAPFPAPPHPTSTPHPGAATPNPTPAPGSSSTSASNWQSGLFDRGSWLESQAGWARTVVTGRARLGGLAVGVIAVESATVMRQQPADPGMPDSCETIVPQAGQVWFPDSAEKTAAAMEEYDAEGLPLFILANWRGFSGGMRDLFDGVLQAGSLIVERLRVYRQPVFVYIPAGAELRGGAWVVVDSQINAAEVEVYADPGARGGVLEPEGVCEIKFRTPDLIKMMHRVDPVIAAARASGAPASDPAVRARERELLPTYGRIARAFADMHDTPVRMAAKGVLTAIVPWAGARAFFATRLRRRLLEQQLLRHAATTDPSLTPERAEALLRAWREAAEASAGAAAAADAGGGGRGSGSGFFGGSGGSSGDAVGGGGDANPLSPTSAALEQQLCGSGGGGGNGSGAAASRLLCDTVSAEAWAARDRAFLAWAESPAGRAQIAGELRSMRCSAAEELVAQVLGTVEGKEGLLHALQGAIQRDGMLALQLRLLLQAGATPAASGAGAAAAQGGGPGGQQAQAP
ncbi:hypothetical protein HXX76_000006 [Chlamydomonas incerta]|uniref:Acetyl-CoA carboxylase n=1 Tax=Chlamydomonas incerta TaxID=51695 RepID=A0A835WDP2_CHLIN|nr:hypothetical protein HXX76_000006 [Chlamydomonas incerta]|eukprot:KAG2445384.1 hypothetical protein HXX76_000006 [Chlamydomonas incerta]